MDEGTLTVWMPLEIIEDVSLRSPAFSWFSAFCHKILLFPITILGCSPRLRVSVVGFPVSDLRAMTAIPGSPTSPTLACWGEIPAIPPTPSFDIPCHPTLSLIGVHLSDTVLTLVILSKPERRSKRRRVEGSR